MINLRHAHEINIPSNKWDFPIKWFFKNYYSEFEMLNNKTITFLNILSLCMSIQQKQQDELESVISYRKIKYRERTLCYLQDNILSIDIEYMLDQREKFYKLNFTRKQ
ncbi:hypothetical protein pb186bvf_002489 [Paramecium bursaria]